LRRNLLFLIPFLICLTLRAETPDQRAQRLLSDILIIDTHVDTPNAILDEKYQLQEKHGYYEADIPRLRQGRAGAIFFGIYAEPRLVGAGDWLQRALELIDALREEVRRNPRDMEMAANADDILRIRQSGKIGALLGLEGGHMINDSLAVLRDYYRLGVRYMTLTHFKNNHWADSGTDTPEHNGLTAFGRDVVKEMNRLGMMVDISHVSDKTFFDALAVSQAPAIASHSAMRAICDIPRNMTDEMIRALAKNDGVVFINFNAAYVDKQVSDAFVPLRDVRDREIAAMMAKNQNNPRRWELRREIQQRYVAKLPATDISKVLQNIDHVAKLAGADHVGLGSDFDGVSGMVPRGMEDVSKYPSLVKGLIDLGYSDADIRKIMGENAIRVLRANEAIARKLSKT
jgi:membrane dipeptidase